MDKKINRILFRRILNIYYFYKNKLKINKDNNFFKIFKKILSKINKKNKIRIIKMKINKMNQTFIQIK